MDGKHNEVELQTKPTPKTHYIRILFGIMQKKHQCKHKHVVWKKMGKKIHIPIFRLKMKMGLNLLFKMFMLHLTILNLSM